MRTPLCRILSIIFASSLVCAGLFVGQAFAEDNEEEELPQSGTLSSNFNSGAADGVAVDGVWGGDDVFSESSAPITGSVSRVNAREWVMKVMNNTEDKYSASVEVEQYNERNKKIRGNHFSYNLDGGERKERVIRVLPQTKQCSLRLKRWRNLTPKKEEGEEEAAAKKK